MDRARHRVLVRADQRRSRAGAVLQAGGVAARVGARARRPHRPVRAPRGDRDAAARHAVPGDREARVRCARGAAQGPDAALEHVLVPPRARPRGRQRRLQVRRVEDGRPDRGRALGGLSVHQAAVQASRAQDPARPQRRAAPVQEGPAPRDAALGAAVRDPDQRRRVPASRRQGARAAAHRVVAGVEPQGESLLRRRSRAARDEPRLQSREVPARSALRPLSAVARDLRRRPLGLQPQHRAHPVRSRAGRTAARRSRLARRPRRRLALQGDRRQEAALPVLDDAGASRSHLGEAGRHVHPGPQAHRRRARARVHRGGDADRASA